MTAQRDRRMPYVWDGNLVDPAVEIDGCYRSAEIDRTEANGYPTGSEDAADCLLSAQRWETQAQLIEREWLATTGAECDDA
ncbi:hypothetical protein [Nocardioides limicola]|uniref:hypothetical protein n=1 Tax=Nocardioides limicola TaxID=2803368 RepID=UPI00193BA649|nr:hypothetical protein [Nocardioides sp. DJM-14]